mgnify:CR=1 FL=1
MRGIRRIQIRKAFVLYIKHNTSFDNTMKLLIVIVQFLLICYQLSIKEVE